MRPLKLEVQGFTAFRQFTELEFGDLELFALVGPTGSGKSAAFREATDRAGREEEAELAGVPA
ncbi:hypothetical protein CTI14_62650 [Methylobacterium radiotolerans]|nr:hypothetical protein CTI14_62650 [Methylobacterium radiotolerans]